jgi:hypothetical protein
MTKPEKHPLRDGSSPATSPPPKRHEAIFSPSPMSPSHDILPAAPRTSDDAAPTGNTAFDHLILNEMAKIRADHPLSKPTALILLNRIVSHASGRLDQRYNEFVLAADLIQEKPELFNLLSSAFESGTFGSIVELREFSICRLQHLPISRALTCFSAFLQMPQSAPTALRSPNPDNSQIHSECYCSCPALLSDPYICRER